MTAAYTSDLAAALSVDVLDRLQRYVRVNTRSTPDRERSPSTPGQLDLGRMLVDELHTLDLADATLDQHGYVYATLAGTVPGAPVIGLIAHMDTSPEVSGAGVQPIVHRDYNGGVIELPKGGTRLDPAAMPELRTKVGHDIVTASGDTLLGADDKAGVAAIMAAVAHLRSNPSLPRPTLRIAFTPDEEIGHGATLFDIGAFGARCAYTVDGGAQGELQTESFTAVEVRIAIDGVAVHPGHAAGRMVSAARLASQLVAQLPSDRLTPETTSGREGFIHLVNMTATPERAELELIVRDFEEDLLDSHVELLRNTARQVVGADARARLHFELTRQYRNMRDYLQSDRAVAEVAVEAIKAEGIEPLREPIRGGTDGSRLSEMGLPTPNLFDGGYEFHSVREWASVQEMAAAAAVLVRLAGLWSRRT
ncbi:MAG: peptidase T [Solirubrobacteraceae bacterium]